jgi:hypothetical protein
LETSKTAPSDFCQISTITGKIEFIKKTDLHSLLETFKQTKNTFEKFGLGIIFKVYLRKVITLEIQQRVEKW